MEQATELMISKWLLLPLTHETLKQCGFKTHRKSKTKMRYIIKGGFVIDKEDADNYYVFNYGKSSTKLIWLHQLQRLHTALMDKELIFKP